jgi:hypothetical protein
MNLYPSMIRPYLCLNCPKCSGDIRGNCHRWRGKRHCSCNKSGSRCGGGGTKKEMNCGVIVGLAKEATVACAAPSETND